MKEIFEIVKKNFPQYTWDISWVIEENDEDDFCTDVESVLEEDEEQIVLDDTVEIKKEISFESDEEVFCQVYTDLDYNINRMFLNID